MEVISNVHRLRNPRRRSDCGDNVLNVQGAVGNDECIPRFRGSTNEFLAIEDEVRAEDVEGEPPFLLPNSAQGVLLIHLRKTHDPTTNFFYNPASLHIVPPEID